MVVAANQWGWPHDHLEMATPGPGGGVAGGGQATLCLFFIYFF
jgi:hypothetical protein